MSTHLTRMTDAALAKAVRTATLDNDQPGLVELLGEQARRTAPMDHLARWIALGDALNETIRYVTLSSLTKPADLGGMLEVCLRDAGFKVLPMTDRERAKAKERRRHG